MGKKCCKFMDVDVVYFLRDQMDGNTISYRCDFEVDKKLIQRFAESKDRGDKTLLWMSRPAGTHLLREREAFVRGTYDHDTWKFYAEQTDDKIVAFAVELTGIKDGVIRGNLYELDYPAHADLVASRSVHALDSEKTFEDGFVDRIPVKRRSYAHDKSLVEKHGAIVQSRTISQDEERLGDILSDQKIGRDHMREAPAISKGRSSIDDLIAAAESKKTTPKEVREKGFDLAR